MYRLMYRKRIIVTVILFHAQTRRKCVASVHEGKVYVGRRVQVA